MSHVSCESKLYMVSCEVKELWLHSCPGNWLEIRRAVLCYAGAAQAFSARIKWRHCRWVVASGSWGEEVPVSIGWV